MCFGTFAVWASHDVEQDKKLEFGGENEMFMNCLICDVMGYWRCLLICYLSYDKLLTEEQSMFMLYAGLAT
jgi:hypothetical protein